jgi:hypothetical protein
MSQQQADEYKGAGEGHNETVDIHDSILKLWLYLKLWVQLIQSLYYPGVKLKSTR